MAYPLKAGNIKIGVQIICIQKKKAYLSNKQKSYRDSITNPKNWRTTSFQSLFELFKWEPYSVVLETENWISAVIIGWK